MGKILAERYRPLSVLGRGSAGRVLLCRDELEGGDVAVKLLDSRMDDEAACKRFQRESRLTAQLEHPNVVRVLNSGVTEAKVPFIVYEWIPGQSLRDFLTARGSPDDSQGRSWCRQLAAAVAAIHRKGILHRDIKCSNVLIREDGVPILCDFGLARPDAEATVLTKTGCLVGTPEFMAPEVLRGEASTKASDVYSMGAVFFEILHDEPWRPVRAIPELATEIAKPDVGFEAHSRFGLHPWDKVLHGALRQDPAMRISDGTDLMEAVSAPEAWTGDLIAASTESPGPRRALSIGLVVALGLGSIGLFRGKATATPPKEDPEKGWARVATALATAAPGEPEARAVAALRALAAARSTPLPPGADATRVLEAVRRVFLGLDPGALQRIRAAVVDVLEVADNPGKLTLRDWTFFRCEVAEGLSPSISRRCGQAALELLNGPDRLTGDPARRAIGLLEQAVSLGELEHPELRRFRQAYLDEVQSRGRGPDFEVSRSLLALATSLLGKATAPSKSLERAYLGHLESLVALAKELRDPQAEGPGPEMTALLRALGKSRAELAAAQVGAEERSILDRIIRRLAEFKAAHDPAERPATVEFVEQVIGSYPLRWDGLDFIVGTSKDLLAEQLRVLLPRLETASLEGTGELFVQRHCHETLGQCGRFLGTKKANIQQLIAKLTSSAGTKVFLDIQAHSNGRPYSLRAGGCTAYEHDCTLSGGGGSVLMVVTNPDGTPVGELQLHFRRGAIFQRVEVRP